MEGVSTTHSGCATPAAAASGDESTENCELGAECPGEEMDTTTTAAAMEDAVMVGPDAATDNLATRYANLDSPADRYVLLPFPSPPPLLILRDRATHLLFVISLSRLSLSRHIARHLSILHCHFCITIAFWVALSFLVFIFLGWLDSHKGWTSHAPRSPTSSARPTP